MSALDYHSYLYKSNETFSQKEAKRTVLGFVCMMLVFNIGIFTNLVASVFYDYDFNEWFYVGYVYCLMVAFMKTNGVSLAKAYLLSIEKSTDVFLPSLSRLQLMSLFNWLNTAALLSLYVMFMS